MKIITRLILTIMLGFLLVLTIQAQDRINTIQKNGVLKVGTTGIQPPFSMEAKDGYLIGYEVDLAEILAESMNVKLELVKMHFNELIPSLEKGEVDIVMSGMTITMERNKKVAFLGPYLLSGKSILTKIKILGKAEEAEDLNRSDLKIASLKGSTGEIFIRDLLPKASYIPVEDFDEALQMLLKDEANVMLADYPVCAFTVLRNPDANLTILKDPLTLEPIGMAMAKEDLLLINFMDNYLNTLRMAGILADLEKYWFESGDWLGEIK